MRILLIIASVIVALYAVVIIGVLEKAEDHPRFYTATPLPADADTSYTGPGLYGGRVLLGTVGDPKTFNPITPSGRTSADIYEVLFPTLVTQNRVTFEMEPRLAKSWEFSEDNRSVIFHMRRGVLWSDGEPVTAYDAAFTYEVIFHPDVPNYLRDQMQVEGEPFTWAVIDSFTFKVTTPKQIAPFLYLAGGNDLHVIPEHILRPELENGTFDAAYNISWPPEKLVTCGPYLLEKFESGVKTVLRRNPNFWRVDTAGNRLPYIERIIFVTLRSFDTEFLNFISGDLDMLERVRLSDVPILEREAEKTGYTVENLGVSTDMSLIWFNLKPGTNPQGEPYIEPYKLKMFSDVRFRRAISHAIDREGIIQRYADGYAVPQYGPETSANKLWYNADVPSYGYDLDKARALLDEMDLKDRDGDGYREDADGNPVEFSLLMNTGGSGSSGTMIKDDLAKVGIDMKISQVEFKTLLVKIHNEFSYEASSIGLVPGNLDPSDGMNVWMSSANMHMWNQDQDEPATAWEARVDELMWKQMTELDREKRKAYYDEVQYIIADQLPLIYTITPLAFVAYDNTLRNVQPSVLTHRLLWNIEEVWFEETDN